MKKGVPDSLIMFMGKRKGANMECEEDRLKKEVILEVESSLEKVKSSLEKGEIKGQEEIAKIPFPDPKEESLKNLPLTPDNLLSTI